MPGVAVMTIILGAVLALALVGAVGVILVQLRRTSGVLEDIDVLITTVPPGLAGLAPTIGRIKAALRSVVRG